jgi:transcriptional regulator with XRE-family HTH domain
MLITLTSPLDISIALARRIRKRRLERGWTQSELAARSSVAVDTLKKFEHTGHIALPRLVRLAIALGCANELESLFRAPVPQSLTALTALTRSSRQRGRALPAAAGSR